MLKLKDEILKRMDDSTPDLNEWIVNDIEETVDNSNNPDEWKSYLQDVQYGGCSSGVVPSMIYHKDIKRFWDNNEDDIYTKMEEYDIQPQVPIYKMAYAVYEVVCFEILEILETSIDFSDYEEDEEEEEE